MKSTQHFNINEFKCSHCSDLKLSQHLLAVLELVRINFNSPVKINSGYRCIEYNRSIGSTDKSQHVLGTAADIVVKGVPPQTVYAFLNKIFPDCYGLGSYTSFTHIDVREGKARWNG